MNYTYTFKELKKGNMRSDYDDHPFSTTLCSNDTSRANCYSLAQVYKNITLYKDETHINQMQRLKAQKVIKQGQNYKVTH
jgi:hypothetical protein